MASKPGITAPILAAEYVRMSTDQQQYSLDNQSDAIRRYAEHNNMRIVRTYSDAGKSGLTLASRPGLRKLIDDVESGQAGFAAASGDTQNRPMRDS